MVRGAFLGWAFYSAQPYLLGLLEDDQIWVVGVITAFMSLSTIAGNQLVEWLTRRCGKRSTIILGGLVVTSLGSISMGVTDSFWIAVPSFLLVTGSLGVITPVRQAYVHHVAPSEHRATVISFDAMLGSMGGVGGQPGLGRLSGAADDLTVGLGRGYVVGGLTTILAWPLVWAVRKRGDEADVIVDSRARAGTCAAQGLPRDTHVAAHPREVVSTR
ncbi:MAG: MFS transporter [Acidimicrobiales bacterium]|nr:MFS transporter [Acidimicrobiales bacterium]